MQHMKTMEQGFIGGGGGGGGGGMQPLLPEDETLVDFGS